ncbi:MAG: hypothetical protein L0K41_05575, partial [Yaniella sp.]|nr:hypothetical protein [Yaniella sp.]
GGLLLMLGPTIPWVPGGSVREAFMLVVFILVFFLIYTAVYAWIFDRVFGLPEPAVNYGR